MRLRPWDCQHKLEFAKDLNRPEKSSYVAPTKDDTLIWNKYLEETHSRVFDLGI
jgi:hypothetical protein